MEAAEGTRAALAAAILADPCFRALSDDGLIAETEAWEAVGRLVDARRVAAAAELEHRSRPALGEQGLAFRQGRRDGPGLVAALARIPQRDAASRVGLGAALQPRVSLLGEELPGRYPEVASSFRSGDVGLASARVIVDALSAARRRAEPEDLEAAERALVEQARMIDTDLLRVHAAVWQARIDPDGAEPDGEEQHRQRAFRIGRTDSHGITAFSGRMPAEATAVLRAALQVHARGRSVLRTEPGGEDDDGPLEPAWQEAEGERRTKAQWDFDTWYSTFTAGVRAEQDGSGVSLKTPHEVVVQITAQEAAARRGSGWVEGVGARVSLPVVERLACSGGVRLLVTDDSGEPLHLGHRTRHFSPAQKKALAARSGGCAWPGCTAPACWTDAHHIAWWQRDHGPTDIDNGVLLCSHHHHLIHAKDGTWRIVLHDREPHLVHRSWTGPPEPRHRMQRHPASMLPPPVDDNPWLAA